MLVLRHYMEEGMGVECHLRIIFTASAVFLFWKWIFVENLGGGVQNLEG